MNRRGWQWLLTVVVVCTVAIAMSGCARKTGSTAGAAGSGDGSGPGGSASGMGPGLAGGMAGTSGSAGGGVGGGTGSDSGPGAGSSLAGGGAITGTTLPALPSPRDFSDNADLKDVHFEYDRYEVRAADKAVLEANARWLRSNAQALLLIEGHADERGTNEYNLALGERRAKATRDYLIREGIDPTRITMTTYGEERPVCRESADTCWARNRRAHFLIKE